MLGRSLVQLLLQLLVGLGKLEREDSDCLSKNSPLQYFALAARDVVSASALMFVATLLGRALLGSLLLLLCWRGRRLEFNQQAQVQERLDDLWVHVEALCSDETHDQANGLESHIASLVGLEELDDGVAAQFTELLRELGK